MFEKLINWLGYYKKVAEENFYPENRIIKLEYTGDVEKVGFKAKDAADVIKAFDGLIKDISKSKNIKENIIVRFIGYKNGCFDFGIMDGDPISQIAKEKLSQIGMWDNLPGRLK